MGSPIDLFGSEPLGGLTDQGYAPLSIPPPSLPPVSISSPSSAGTASTNSLASIIGAAVTGAEGLILTDKIPSSRVNNQTLGLTSVNPITNTAAGLSATGKYISIAFIVIALVVLAWILRKKI